MKHFNKFLAVLVLGIMLLLITACGSSSSGPATSSMVVTPSLGEVTDETFAMYQIDGTLVSTTSVIQPDGTIMVNYPTTITGPIYIEISGNATATYFDEASGMFLPFPAGQTFRTYMVSPLALVGISALTELAASLLDNLPAITASFITQANEIVRTALAPSLASITDPPQLIGSAADLSTFTANDAGEYAAILAAIANLANGVAGSSVPEIVSQLSLDLGDGTIDGMNGATPISNLIYNGTVFPSDLSTAIINATMGTPLSGTVFMAGSSFLDGFGITLSGSIVDPDNLGGMWQLKVNGVIENTGLIAEGAVTYNLPSQLVEITPPFSTSYEVSSLNPDCTVTNGIAMVSTIANLSNINITCTTPTTPPPVTGANLTGTISNPSNVQGQWELSGTGIFNDGQLTDGAVMYNFIAVPNDTMYQLILDVSTSPGNGTCTVTPNATGTIANSTDVTGIDITCIAAIPE